MPDQLDLGLPVAPAPLSSSPVPAPLDLGLPVAPAPLPFTVERPVAGLELPPVGAAPGASVVPDVVSGGVGAPAPIARPTTVTRPAIELGRQPPLPGVSEAAPQLLSPTEAALVEPRQRVADVTALRQTVAERQSEHNQRRVALGQELAQTDDPDRQAEIVNELRELSGRTAVLSATDRAAQQAGQVELAGLDAAAGAARQAAERELKRAYLVDAQDRAEAAKAEADKRAADVRQARTVATERRQALQSKLQEDVPNGAAQAALGLIGELLVARAQRRPPDFSVALRFAENAQARYRTELEQLRQSAALADEDVTGQLELSAQIDAEMKAMEAASLAELDRELARVALDSQGLPQGTAADLARIEMRGRLEAAEIQAAQAQADADLARRKAEADIARIQAQTAKTIGDTKRRGGGKAQVEGGGVVVEKGTSKGIPANLVTLADGTVLTEFEDSSAGAKRAKEAGGAVSAFFQAHSKVRRIIDTVDQLGGRELRDLTGATVREKMTRLEKQIAFLAPDLSRIKANGFAPTEADEKWARDVIGQLGFTNKDQLLNGLDEITTQLEETFRAQGGAVGLRPRDVERTIGFSTSRTPTQRERRNAELRNATRTLADADAQTEERIAAIPLLVESLQQRPETADKNVAQLAAINSLKGVLAQTDDAALEAAAANEIARLREEIAKGDRASVERTSRQRDTATGDAGLVQGLGGAL